MLDSIDVCLNKGNNIEISLWFVVFIKRHCLASATNVTATLFMKRD